MAPISKKQQRLNRRHQPIQPDEPSSPEPQITTQPSLPLLTPIPVRQKPTPLPQQPSDSKRRPLKKFHLFPTLPQDLRLLIWSHTFPPPTTFHLTLIRCHTGRQWATFIPPMQTPSTVPLAWVTVPEDCLCITGDWNQDMYSTDKGTYVSPVGLCVNWEIRRFVLGRYERLNVWDRVRSWRAESWGWRRVWFLRDRDVLVFGMGGCRGLEGERAGVYEMRGGAIGGSIGVQRVWVVGKEARKDGNGDGSVEVRKEVKRERDRKQILEVQKAFEGVVEIGLVNRGNDRDFDWKIKQAVIIARKGNGGDWFIGEERIISGNLERV